MSDFNIGTTVEASTKPEGQRQRTRIEDLLDIGYELSEEHLQMVTGGNNLIYTSTNVPGFWAGNNYILSRSDSDY